MIVLMRFRQISLIYFIGAAPLMVGVVSILLDVPVQSRQNGLNLRNNVE